MKKKRIKKKYTDFKTGKLLSFKELPFERRCTLSELAKIDNSDPEMKALQKHYETERKAKTRRKKLALKILALRNQE